MPQGYHCYKVPLLSSGDGHWSSAWDEMRHERHLQILALTLGSTHAVVPFLGEFLALVWTVKASGADKQLRIEWRSKKGANLDTFMRQVPFLSAPLIPPSASSLIGLSPGEVTPNLRPDPMAAVVQLQTINSVIWSRGEASGCDLGKETDPLPICLAAD